MERWEYLTTFITADARSEEMQQYQTIEGHDLPKYSPKSLMPELNHLGEKGWELVHIQPVIVGKNEDVLVHPNNMVYWGNNYFCVFKRRI